MVYHGKGSFILPEGLLGVHGAGLNPCTEQGSKGSISFPSPVFPAPAGTKPLGYGGKKCGKCCSSLGNFILTLPINGEVLNQSYFHREPKSSGCLFISLSLTKPNYILKIVLLPYANQQGMVQQAGNETGE